MKKKQIKNYLKIGILLFGILLTFPNCEKDDSILSQSSIEIVQKQKNELLAFEKNFSLKNYQDDFIKNNLIINWNNYSVYDALNSSKIYEFNSNLNAKISSKKENISFYSEFKVQAIVDTQNNISYQIIKYLSTKKNYLKNITLNSLNNFSGTIYYFNLEGIILKIEAYEKGLKINTFTNNSNDKNISAKEAPVGSIGSWVLVYTIRWTDWYQNFLGGNIVYFYTHSTYNGTTSEWVYVSNGGGFNGSVTYHSHFDDPHGPSPSTYIDNHPEEIIIDTSFENIDKINCTYEQLLKISNIQQLLSSFFGSDAENNITFQVESNLNCGNNGTPDGGCTTLNSDGSVTIKIDQTYINNVQTPTLFIAKTIIHEAIHANLYMAVKALNNGVEPTSSDFSDLYEQYRELKNWQHEFMADRYINLISQTLQDVHPFLGDQGFINDRTNNYPDWNWTDFYTEIAWLGLYDTSEGQKHLQDPNYTNNSNIYVIDVKGDSTKNPKCD